jgi:hypothetical protein
VLTLINGKLLEISNSNKQFTLSLSFVDPPSLPLHIQLCVEDSEERLTDTQVEELIEIAKKYLVQPVVT